MSYYERIRELTKNVPATLVDFSLPRDPARTPTQASSNFITKKEQGDWAENLITRAINETSKNFVAIKYGKSDDLVAGEDGFDAFYQNFQSELDSIGKRPDLLIFWKADFDEKMGFDISQIPHHQITEYVKKAVAGIEVRSSAYISERYKEAMQARIKKYSDIALATKSKILTDFSDILNEEKKKNYRTILEGITEDTLNIAGFRTPGWHSSERLVELNNHFKTLKEALETIQKRADLSITVKNEDLQVVYRWIEVFNIPHFYFQVFFDKVIGLSFENILEIISDAKNEDSAFYTEKNKKNQDKPTIHINFKKAIEIAAKVAEPMHESVRRELNRGQLLFYVTFKGGIAYLDVNNLCAILGINKTEF
jgi:hypothetical protein